MKNRIWIYVLMFTVAILPPIVAWGWVLYAGISQVSHLHLLLFSGAWPIMTVVAFETRTKFLTRLIERFKSFLRRRAQRAEEATVIDSSLKEKIQETESSAIQRYLMIGDTPADEDSPSSLNKVDFLRHSGIDFRPPPVGQTQEAELFRTETASVIDTAWDYVNHNQQQSRESWLTFFKAIDASRRSPADTRKKGPVFDAIILVVELEKIAESSFDQNIARAAIIREQIQDIAKSLGIRLPVYLVVSKCETIRGFETFFQSVRNQQPNELVWGFALNSPETDINNSLDKEGNILYRSLLKLAYKQLLSLNDADRLRVYLFPQRFKHKWEKVKVFANALFARQDAESPMLRGVYFTAHQHGASYFTHKLLTEIFNDQNLVRPTDEAVEIYKDYRRKRRQKWLKWVSIGLLLLLIVGGVVWYANRPVEKEAIIHANVPIEKIEVNGNKLPVEKVLEKKEKIWSIKLPARGKVKVTVYPKDKRFKPHTEENVKVEDKGQVFEFLLKTQ